MGARARVALATAVVLGLLAGCRTVPPPAPAVIGPGADAPWSEQYAALANLADYALTGRVAVAANGQGFSANLRYRQQQALEACACNSTSISSR
jgi:outer membrane biogenesis lipoprotein LolB